MPGLYSKEWLADLNKRKAEAAERAAQATKLSDSNWIRNASMTGMMDAQGREAPQAANTRVGTVSTYGGANINMTPQDEFRRRELELADRAMAIGSGQMQGAGELAAQRQGQRAAAMQIGMARGMRGPMAGVAARSAARNVGNLGIATAGQAQTAALQDQQVANQTAAGLLGAGRGADIGLATSQAGLQQQAGLASMDAKNQRVFQQAGLDQATSLANMQARLSQTGMNDQASLQYLAQLYGVNTAEMAARLQREAMLAGSSGGGFGDYLQAAGTVGGAIIGGVYGGPAGAAVGAKAGGAVGGAAGGA